MEYIEDVSQERKVRYELKDILVIALFATLTNVDDWVKMEMFKKEYQNYLRKYIELENGIHPMILLTVSRGCCLRKFPNRCMESGRNS